MGAGFVLLNKSMAGRPELQPHGTSLRAFQLILKQGVRGELKGGCWKAVCKVGHQILKGLWQMSLIKESLGIPSVSFCSFSLLPAFNYRLLFSFLFLWPCLAFTAGLVAKGYLKPCLGEVYNLLGVWEIRHRLMRNELIMRQYKLCTKSVRHAMRSTQAFRALAPDSSFLLSASTTLLQYTHLDFFFFSSRSMAWVCYSAALTFGDTHATAHLWNISSCPCVCNTRTTVINPERWFSKRFCVMREWLIIICSLICKWYDILGRRSRQAKITHKTKSLEGLENYGSWWEDFGLPL